MSAQDLSSSEVVRRGIRGAAALAGRQAVAQGLNIVGAVLLANLLGQAEFGIYGITVFVLHFLVAFGDVGLAGSLIREKDSPCEADYRTVFTAQQLFVAVVVLVGLSMRTWAAGHFSRPDDIALLSTAALLSLAITSFQVIPSVRLERELRFDRLAIVEVGQALSFNVVAVGCAWAGYGAASMAYALVARSLSGALLVQTVEPWRPAWGWSWARLQERLRFGIPYQGALSINLVRDALTPVFIGTMLGEAVVGQVFWASMMATYPLIVLHMFGRLYLPAFARLQDRPAEQNRIVALALFATSCLAIPTSLILLVLIVPISELVFAGKWVDALPIYYWIWAGTFLEGSVVVALPILNAAGRADLVFRMVAALAALTWLFGVILITTLGPIGYGVMGVVLQPIKVWIVWEGAKRSLGWGPWWRVLAPLWGAGVVLTLVVGGATQYWQPQSLLALGSWAAFGMIFYAGLVVLIDTARAQRAWLWLRAEMRRA